MLSKYEAQTASEFHHVTETQSSGQQCARVRRNGRTRTWKTRPDEFVLPVKWGMRDQFSIHEIDADCWNVADKCPRCNGSMSGAIGRYLTIASTKRLTNSVNGNPRFTVGFTDGTIATTQSDASCSYDIDNLTRSKAEAFYVFTPAGRISYTLPVNPLARANKQ
jgi:hypothetical protein